MELSVPCALFFDAKEFFDFFIENANYWYVFIFMIIESSFIPFPSELVIPPAVYLAVTQENMSVVGVVAVATLGALGGALVNYYLSVWIGRPIVYKFANSRLGHLLLLNQAKVERAEAYFDKHGAVSTFIGRLIPAVRQLISIPAGLARMNIWIFMAFTTLGALVWNCILAALGYWLGKTVSLDVLQSKIEEYNEYLTYGGMALLAICVIYMVYRWFSHKHNTTDNIELK